jgi:hypothetical protein
MCGRRGVGMEKRSLEGVEVLLWDYGVVGD